MFNITFLKTLNILYIESNQNTGKHFLNILNKMFNDVVYKETANEAIEIFKNNQDFSIVICDIQLEDKSGIDVLKELRQINPELPFILTTKESTTSDLLEAVKLNADDFLLKPINPKDLISAVEKICHSKYQEILQKQTVKDLDDMIKIINEIALVSKTNLNDEIIFINDSFAKVTGYETNELLGKTHDIIRDISSSKQLFEDIKNTIYSGKIWEGKLKNFSKDREEFYVYLNTIPIFDEDDNIKEFIWIRFLITEYEQEHKAFKKNVAKNIHHNRRVNNDAREKIDELKKKIAYYENIDKALVLEKHRNAKFENQINYYDTELKDEEKRLKNISEIANKRIAEVVQSEKATRKDKEKVDSQLEDLTIQFKEKNREIQNLTKELDREKALITQLKQKIIQIESDLN